MFHLVKLTDEQLDDLEWVVERARSRNIPIFLGYDETDQSIRWRMGENALGIWSQPYKTEERA